MANISLPDDCSKQWEVLLLLISSEEKKIDRTSENEIETMSYFFNNEGVKRILSQWLQQMELTFARHTSETDTSHKSDEISLHWRQRGNDNFRQSLFDESYKCYTKSLLYARPGGPMYPLALANRSAALLKLRNFKSCLEDLALAFSQGYPFEQQHKLLLRRADCHIELGAIGLARDALNIAKAHVSRLNLPASYMSEFNNNVRTLQNKIECFCGDVANQNEMVPIMPDIYNGINAEFDKASNALELRRSEDAGRHVITKEPMRRGDVIFSEEPYAFVTLPTEEPVCEGCCGENLNAIPCDECSRSVYCSETCRDRACAIFHRWECAGARAQLFPTIGIAHLALRVLIVGAFHKFPKVPDEDEYPTTALELFTMYSQVDNVRIYREKVPAFYRMFNLVTNFDKMNNTDYIQYALTATMLTTYLEQCTTFFDYLPSRMPYALPPNELRLFAGALILHSLGQLVCNGHATISLYPVIDGMGVTMSEHEVRRATAIYPSAAMMNHSCDPNIVNTFYKTRLVVRCSREIAAGGQVFNCYGPHRAREPTQHRRAQLRAQYMFTCNCDDCTDTDRVDFVLLFSAYSCQSCKGPVLRTGRRTHCQQCQTDFNLDNALATLDRAEEMLARALDARTPEERCEGAHASLRLKQQVLHRHHTSLRAAADGLARMYAEYGEYSKSVELIKQNVQSLEYQFGSFSVEVAHEMRKLADVMFSRIVMNNVCTPGPEFIEWCMEAHKISKKSAQLMELNYGSWERLVNVLRKQERFIGQIIAQSQDMPSEEELHRSLYYHLRI